MINESERQRNLELAERAVRDRQTALTQESADALRRQRIHNMQEAIQARANLPLYARTRRLKEYVEYLDNNEWQQDTDTLTPLIVLLVLPTISDLKYTKRVLHTLLLDTQSEHALHI